MPARVSILSIATPEGVTFSLPLAGPITRGVAYFLDLIIIMAALQALSPLFNAMAVVHDLGGGLVLLIKFAAMEGFRMLSELIWRGKTLGKKMMGLRVIDERGLKLRPSQVVVRNLLRFVDFLPLLYAVGGTICLFNSRSQRLGDLVAGTVVVRTVRPVPPDVASLLAGKYNSFREFPHLEARLRQKITPEEAQLALHSLVRREELEPAARVSIYETLANLLRNKVKFPEEAVYGLSDEQYVRNVVETVFRKRA